MANSKVWIDFLLKERKFVNKYGGGAIKEYTNDWEVLVPVLNAPEFTFSDKINIVRGAFFSFECLLEEVMTANLFEIIDRIEIPIYFFQGIDDYQTFYKVANEFFEHLKAPQKK